MEPMMAAGPHAGLFLLLLPIHILGMLAFVSGFLFLLIWALKHLSAAKLKMWGFWLLIGGAVVCILTFGLMSRAGGHGRFSTYGGWNNANENDEGTPAYRMMGTEDKTGAATGEDMSMTDMLGSLSANTGDTFDRAFLEMMIVHHQGAIDMAKLAQTKAKHPEIKKLAAGILTAQQREIVQMKAWQKAWGYTK